MGSNATGLALRLASTAVAQDLNPTGSPDDPPPEEEDTETPGPTETGGSRDTFHGVEIPVVKTIGKPIMVWQTWRVIKALASNPAVENALVNSFKKAAPVIATSLPKTRIGAALAPLVSKLGLRGIGGLIGRAMPYVGGVLAALDVCGDYWNASKLKKDSEERKEAMKEAHWNAGLTGSGAAIGAVIGGCLGACAGGIGAIPGAILGACIGAAVGNTVNLVRKGLGMLGDAVGVRFKFW